MRTHDTSSVRFQSWLWESPASSCISFTFVPCQQAEGCSGIGCPACGKDACRLCACSNKDCRRAEHLYLQHSNVYQIQGIPLDASRQEIAAALNVPLTASSATPAASQRRGIGPLVRY